MTTKIKSGVIGDNVVGITQLNVSDGTNGQVLTTDGSGTLSFSTISGYTDSDVETYLNTSEIYTDATNNRLGIGTTSPEKILHIKTSVNNTAFARIESTATDSYPTLSLKNDAREYQLTAHGPLGDKFTIYDGTAGAHRFVIDSSGNVGIGATTVDEKIHVEVSSGDAGLKLEDATSYMRLDQNSVGADNVLRFKTGSSLDERMRIDSSGRVGINRTPSITNSKLEVGGADNVPLINVEASGYTGGMGIGSTGLQLFHGSTARMKITSTGYAQMGLLLQGDSALNVTETRASTWTGGFYNKNSSPYGVIISFQDAAPNNATNRFLSMNDYTAVRAAFYSDGGLHNYQSNDSNLSDEREKKNIEDLSSTWDCVKSWNLRKFHYNEDEDSDDKRLGVIAQEVEIECPEVITEWKKQEQKDEVLWTEEDELPEGVSIGDVKTAAQEEIIRKGVKEQQMYWMAIKALQEAMTEIEDLKSRIETLEG